MNLSKTKSIFLGCLLLALLPSTSLAQDEDPVARERALERDRQEEQRQRLEQEQQQRINETREQFVNTEIGRARRSVEYSSASTSPLRVEREFMSAVPQFRDAVASYKQAVGFDSSLKTSLKDMERLVDLFKEYFKRTRVDFPLLDKAQFNNTSKKELISETLTTAERVDSQLRLAVMQMQDANSTNTVSIDTVLFMRDLHGDVLRLDLLLSKVK